MFRFGETVRIKKKSRVVDKDRKHEGVDPKHLAPIDQDVSGEQWAVCADTYFSEERGENMIPLKLGNEAMVSVPESRLERTGPRVVQRDGGGQSSPSPMNSETMEFWARHFKQLERAKKKRIRK